MKILHFDTVVIQDICSTNYKIANPIFFFGLILDLQSIPFLFLKYSLFFLTKFQKWKYQRKVNLFKGKGH